MYDAYVSTLSRNSTSFVCASHTLANCHHATQTLDASPKYIFGESVPDKIRLAFPGQKLKIIMLLREPVMRAYSNYVMNARKGEINVWQPYHHIANHDVQVSANGTFEAIVSKQMEAYNVCIRQYNGNGYPSAVGPSIYQQCSKAALTKGTRFGKFKIQA